MTPWARAQKAKKAYEDQLQQQVEQLREQVAQYKRQKMELQCRHALLSDLVEARGLWNNQVPLPVDDMRGHRKICPICSGLSGEQMPAELQTVFSWISSRGSLCALKEQLSEPSVNNERPSCGTSSEDTVGHTGQGWVTSLLLSPVLPEGFYIGGVQALEAFNGYCMTYLAGLAARVEQSMDADTQATDAKKLRAAVVQFYHIKLFHTPKKYWVKSIKHIVEQCSPQKCKALTRKLRGILEASSLPDQQLYAAAVAQATFTQRIRRCYLEREQIAACMESSPSPYATPNHCLNIAHQQSVDSCEKLHFNVCAELCLALEWEWVLFTQLLSPLVVAKLLTAAYPAHVDQFLIALILTDMAASRGLLRPEEALQLKHLWEMAYKHPEPQSGCNSPAPFQLSALVSGQTWSASVSQQ